MKSEQIRMLRYASMIKSVAFCATTFAFISVIFKNSIVLVPEVTEIRLCNILTCCYGIWFGPAGAWGCAIGNLVGDMGGSLTWLSIFGFAGNFVSAWIPYKLWGIQGNVFGEDQLDRPSTKSRKWALRYLVCALVSVVACAALLAVPFDISRSLSAASTFKLVFLNNMGAAIIGLILFVIMSQLPSNVLPYWREMMTDDRNMVFYCEHRTKVAAMIVISVMSALFFFIYSAVKGISLTNIETCGNAFTMTVAGAIALALIVLTAMCRWGMTKAQAISLD